MRSSGLLVLVCYVLTAGAGFTETASAPVPEPAPEKIPLAASELAVPDDVLRHIREQVNFGDRRLGFTAEQMKFFGRDAFVLRTVENLFRDAAALPRESGRIATALIEAASGRPSDPTAPARANAMPGVPEVVRLGYGLIDVSAGRSYFPPEEADPEGAGGAAGWGVSWIPKGTKPGAALDIVVRYDADPWGPARGAGPASPAVVGGAGTAPTAPTSGAAPPPGSPAAPSGAAKAERARKAPALPAAVRTELDRLRALPEPVARLTVRLFAAAAEAEPWLRAAYRPAEPALLDGIGARSASELSIDRVYPVLAAPWTEETNNQTATLRGSAFELLRRVDRDYQAYGSVIYFTHIQRALDELAAAKADLAAAPDKLAFGRILLPTALGSILILGTGDDVVADEPHLFVVDLGGKTVYKGRQATPALPRAHTSAVIDLAGDDVYDGGDKFAAIGCGLLGVGAVIDLDGNDIYRCVESGIGSALFGTGIVYDAAGDDRYEAVKGWAQGHAICGVGALIDTAGNDRYSCGFESQAHGGTLGAGLLVDVAGNDSYVARDDGAVSALYLNQSVAMSQGASNGRRADMGDGHSLAGGFGVLVDGAGDDTYHAQVWSQGAGYWWGVGILEDFGGNDTYRNGKYSLGAAAHFAIGVQVDLAGDDRYNVGNDTAVNQFQGHARDGSIGVSVDAAGNDQYWFRTHCAGSGDLNSIAFFWDRAGDDVYEGRWNDLGPPNGWTDTPPMGSATTYPPFRSFRDDLLTVGVFLDGGGSDEYRWTGPDDIWLGGDDREWRRNTGPASWSLGVDRQPAAAAP